MISLKETNMNIIKIHLLFVICINISICMASSLSGGTITNKTIVALSDTIINAAKPFNIIHVDTVFGNDINSGSSRQNALKTIQAAIIKSQDDDTILVWPGVYNETVDFYGKAVTVKSAADAAVISNPNGYGVRFHSAEGYDSILKNFVIRDCVYAVQVESSSPVIENVTVVQNLQGIIADGVADPNIANSIFWANQFGDLVNCDAQFSWIQDCQSGSAASENDGTGVGSPMFTDPNSNDFHLKSEMGRFYPEPVEQPAMFGVADGVWVVDRVTSSCIDAGDPELDPSLEGSSNGGRLNIGAYGGTPYASKSEYPLAADFNRDGIVDLIDFAVLSSQWLDTMPWHQ